MQLATRRAIRLLTLPLAASALTAPRAAAQTVSTWNNTGTNSQAAANWTPTGVPTGLALFNQSGSATGTTVTGPSVSGSSAALSMTTGLGQNFGGWNFTGSGTLTLGGTGSSGLSVTGPQTTTFNGPSLAGSGLGSINSLGITVAASATLVLAGPSVAVVNAGSTFGASGGTIRLDNSGTSVPNRLAAGAAIDLGGGGALELVGNAAGGTYTVGALNLATSVGGVNAIRVTPLTASVATTLQFSNLNLGSTGGFSSRPGGRSAVSYEATAGDLGAVNGAQIRFTGTPYLGANGLLSTANGGGGVGFAIVKDAGGTDFATYAANGVSRTGAVATTTATTAAELAGLGASSRGQFSPAAGSTTTVTGALSPGSLRVTPAGAGATLALGTNAFATNALMLDGPIDFVITGTGPLGVTTPQNTRFVYVNNSAATLSMSQVVANGLNPTVFAGPGFVDLTRAGTQNTLSTSPTATANRFVIAGGTVRANTAQVGFAATGGNGVVSLTGGVLEIKGGSNGTGAAADFTRPVGGTSGAVTWGAGTSFEAGGGGFSAYGAAASVNLGGAGTALTWNQADFVPVNLALKFGSTQSNAVLTWLNPVNLSTAAAPAVREFNVTAGAGGDRTVLAGVISGTAATDFLKTGTGELVLGAANTYTGATLVHGGTLTLGATNAVAPTGGVFLGNARLSSGVAGGFSANLGALSLTTGTPTVALGTGSHTLSFTTLAVNVPGLAVTGFTGTAGASGTGGRLVFTGLGSSSAAANGSFASFLAGTSFSGYALGATFIASGASLELVPAPVPEPAAVFGLAALGLGAAGFARRWRAKTPRS